MSTNGPDSNNKTTVYVSGLPAEITQENIAELFKQYGKITNIELKNRKNTPTSSAFVTFETHEQASKVIEECNYSRVGDSSLHIQWQMMNPHNHNYNSNLVIKELPSKVEEASLNSHFRKYGEVLSCKIIKKGNDKNIGYVQFARVEDANKALDDLQNALIEGQPVYVDKFVPREDRANILVQLPHQAISIDHANKGLLEADKIKQTFAKYGQILDVLSIDAYTIVYFADSQGPAKIISEPEVSNKGYTTSARVPNHITMKVRQFIDSRCIFVADIAPNNNEALKKHLSSVGGLVHFEVPTKNLANTFVSAEYESEAIRQQAIEKLDRTTFEGQDRPIRVLPYIARSTIKQPVEAGFLMLNHIDYNSTYQSLRAQYSKYGRVVTVSICPTPQATLTGFILFEKYEDAVTAKADSKNAFLFPRVSVSNVLFYFYSTQWAKNNFLFVFDIPESTSDAQIFSTYSQYGGSINFIKTVHVGNVIHALIQYREDSSLTAILGYLKENKIRHDVYSIHTIIKAYQLLHNIDIPKDYLDRFLFFNGLPQSYTSQNVYDYLNQKGFKVEAVNMIYNWDTLEPCQRASILFESSEHASNCYYNPAALSDLPEVLISPFVNAAQSTHQQIQPVQPPRQEKVIKRPRQYLVDRTKERSDLTDEQKDKIIEQIGKLSINQTYDFAHDDNKWNEYIKSI